MRNITLNKEESLADNYSIGIKHFILIYSMSVIYEARKGVSKEIIVNYFKNSLANWASYLAKNETGVEENKNKTPNLKISVENNNKIQMEMEMENEQIYTDNF